MPQFFDTQRADGHIAAVLRQIHQTDTVGISLIATDMQRAAAVTYGARRIRHGLQFQGIVRMAECLRLMDMAQSRVIVARTERSKLLGTDRPDFPVAGQV